MNHLRCTFLVLLLIGCFTTTSARQPVVYDVVLTGGRVIDPDTKLDALRNVGILHGQISQISTGPLSGKQVINVAGLVVAPGFIDLHVHDRNNVEQEFQMHDGVTSVLELEW
ncbi:MAG TPA: hypothetical protein PLX35_13055 [Cyclobacteriaceae bacterium]|nr:hypothetical protein [Cyclobacteriaceae bacterium]